jgi:hypothetical protein
MWPSAETYQDTDAKYTWFIVTTRDIPAGIALILFMRSDAPCSLISLANGTVYASSIGSGAVIDVAAFTRHSSLIAFSQAAVSGTAFGEARPQFAIGFQFQTNTDGFNICGAGLSPAQLTSPNFPDVHSAVDQPWQFLYTVVFPAVVPVTVDAEQQCVAVTAIKFAAKNYTTFVPGPWKTAAAMIAQPYTVIGNTYNTVNKWTYKGVYGGPTDYVALWEEFPDVTTFQSVVAPGGLVPILFRPRYKNMQTISAPAPGAVSGIAYYDVGPAILALLVTIPIQPNVVTCFTIDAYDESAQTFRNAVGEVAVPTFIWTTSTNVVPAGTVVYFTNIGFGTITVADARGVINVGSAAQSPTPTDDYAVVSITAVNKWRDEANPDLDLSPRIVCAALSDEYAGDYPPLTPGLTIVRQPMCGFTAWGYDQTPVDACGIPALSFAAIINSGEFQTLPWTSTFDPLKLPSFMGLKTCALV